jgi:galactose mutarotase-like enzyme
MRLTKLQFQGETVYTLESGSSRAWVCPHAGGRLLKWEVAGVPIIHWPESNDWKNPGKIRGGNPILFPFLGRHFHQGKQNFWQHQNGTVLPMPMHGFARDSAFTLETEDNICWMTLTDSPETRVFYPYLFRFRVGYSVEENGLWSHFQTTNLGNEPLPYYAGHHFYFRVPHQRRNRFLLSLPARRWARQGKDGSIRFEPSLTSKFLLSDYSAVDRFHIELKPGPIELADLDNGGRTTFDRMDSGDTPWFAVTTWTQSAASDFYCIEPWLGLPNAIDHGHGLRWLSPGKTETASLRLQHHPAPAE